MRRRICLVAVAVIATLAVGVGAASAAKSKKPAAKPVAVAQCKLNLTTALPAGSATLSPPIEQGAQYGSAVCHKAFGRGVQANGLTVQDTGDTTGPYTLYFATGSLHGKYDLTPAEGQPPTLATFAATDYAGTLTIASGTGAYARAKGTGTLLCSSPDDIHLSCSEKLKLAQI